MAQDFAKQFYQSTAWKQVRELVRIRDHNLCVRCGNVADIAHHKVWLTPQNINNPDITLNLDNLEMLCIDCHNNEHMSKGSTIIHQWDKDGNLVGVNYIS